MVKVEVLSLEDKPAILARVLISLKDVVSCELDFFFRQLVKQQKQDNSRNAYFEGNGANSLEMRLILGKILPLREIKGLKGTVLASRDNLCPAFEEQRQCPSSGANINGLP